VTFLVVGTKNRIVARSRPRCGCVEDDMRGVIETKDTLSHLGTIWREFGGACVVRCLLAIISGSPATFLDIAFATERHRRR
jgi:hypothetical protein